jgi:hypothetical protein
MIHSKKFTIDLRDVLHGFVTAFATATLAGILDIGTSGTLPTVDNIKSQIIIGLTAGVGYLVKKFMTTSDGKIMGTEPSNSLK